MKAAIYFNTGVSDHDTDGMHALILEKAFELDECLFVVIAWAVIKKIG